MKRRIPENAFDLYQSLGAGRSYEALADRFGVSKRAIVKAAARERWQERLDAIQAKARERSDERSADALRDITERHLKVLRYIQGRAIETLKSTPLESAMDAVRAYGLAVDKERLLLGEPTERSAVSIEEVTKRELAALLLRPGERESEIESYESGEASADPAGAEPGAEEEAQ